MKISHINTPNDQLQIKEETALVDLPGCWKQRIPSLPEMFKPEQDRDLGSASDAWTAFRMGTDPSIFSKTLFPSVWCALSTQGLLPSTASPQLNDLQSPHSSAGVQFCGRIFWKKQTVQNKNILHHPAFLACLFFYFFFLLLLTSARK